MEYKRGLGIFLISIGVFLIIIQPFTMTGAVIDLTNAFSRIGFFIGLVLIIGGAVLVHVAGRGKLVRIIDQELKSGSVKDYDYLIRLIEKIGCSVVPGKGSHYKVIKPDGKPLIGHTGRPVEIPDHKKGVATGTYRRILKDVHAYIHSPEYSAV